jgi:gamma-glutamylcyclotransferase (GGCT)/AIG2-like uncharacterized protein YtfP
VADRDLITAVFVYGTLQRGQLRGGMWPCQPVLIEPAVVRGELYDLGAYPGLRFGDDWVLGERWTFLPQDIERTLTVLDGIEGYDAASDSGLYLRRTIDVFPLLASPVRFDEAHPIPAWTYLLPDSLDGRNPRRIAADQAWGSERVARWPDKLARVPTRLDDE